MMGVVGVEGQSYFLLSVIGGIVDWGSYFVSLLGLVVASALADVRGKQWWEGKERIAEGGGVVFGVLFLVNVFRAMSEVFGYGVGIEVFGFVLLFVSFLFPAFFGQVREVSRKLEESVGWMRERLKEGGEEGKVEVLVWTISYGMVFVVFGYLLFVLAVGISVGLFGFVVEIGTFTVLGLMLVAGSGIGMLCLISFGMIAVSQMFQGWYRKVRWGDGEVEDEGESEGEGLEVV